MFNLYCSARRLFVSRPSSSLSNIKNIIKIVSQHFDPILSYAGKGHYVDLFFLERFYSKRRLYCIPLLRRARLRTVIPTVIVFLAILRRTIITKYEPKVFCLLYINIINIISRRKIMENIKWENYMKSKATRAGWTLSWTVFAKRDDKKCSLE